MTNPATPETIDKALDESLDRWLRRDPDAGCRDELVALRDRDDHAELASRFAGRLQFGTAGIRGVVGAGPMRMNRLVVRETTAGLAAYLLQTVERAADRGVVVTFDARPDSEAFAHDAAAVLLGAGLRVYLTDSHQPTPVGAFGVLELGAAAGIVVTASHNPPEYNGYKVYWENGAQIIPPHDAGIAACIDTAASAAIPWLDPDDDAGDRLTRLGAAFVDRYCERILGSCRRDAARPAAVIDVAYTALHGVGADIAGRLAADSGLCRLASVPAQHQPDGRFPTVRFPNPEEPGAMDAVIDLARERDALLALANDPDADRLAVAARTGSGDYRMLSGDQVGVLLGHYLLERHDGDAVVCASMVSSRMLGRIAARYDADYFETLTGFKWLANVGLDHERDDKPFLFAYEEALGYAVPQAVRDKDGLSALLAFVQLAAELDAAGATVLDRLDELYREYGLYLTEQRSLPTSVSGPSITELLRSNAPATIGELGVVSVKDLQSREHRFADGRTETLDNHPADVLMYYLDDESRIIVRPSGTEPKTKCYYEVVAPVADDGMDAARSLAGTRLDALADAHQAAIASLTGA